MVETGGETSIVIIEKQWVSSEHCSRHAPADKSPHRMRVRIERSLVTQCEKGAKWTDPQVWLERALQVAGRDPTEAAAIVSKRGVTRRGELVAEPWRCMTRPSGCRAAAVRRLGDKHGAIALWATKAGLLPFTIRQSRFESGWLFRMVGMN